MSDVIQDLRERKSKLLEELGLIDQYLKLHGRLFPAGVSENKSGVEPKDTDDKSEARRNDPSAVAKRAEQVIRQHGKPLQRGNLVRMIEESGLPIHSKDKNKYIGTVLWRHRDTFVNVEDQGYWINGLAIESLPSFDL